MRFEADFSTSFMVEELGLRGVGFVADSEIQLSISRQSPIEDVFVVHSDQLAVNADHHNVESGFR
jgi:hypothetical protein